MSESTARSQVFVGAGTWTSQKKSGGLFRQAAENGHWESLKKGLPANSRATVQKQFSEIKLTHDRVKQMRDSKSASGIFQSLCHEFTYLNQSASDRALRTPSVLGDFRELRCLQS